MDKGMRFSCVLPQLMADMLYLFDEVELWLEAEDGHLVKMQQKLIRSKPLNSIYLKRNAKIIALDFGIQRRSKNAVYFQTNKWIMNKFRFLFHYK